MSGGGVLLFRKGFSFKVIFEYVIEVPYWFWGGKHRTEARAGARLACVRSSEEAPVAPGQ